MLTKVILDGPLGTRFGREWDLAVSSPTQAIALIEANKPGLVAWIRMNREKYANYRVTITTRAGKRIKLNNETYKMQNDPPKEIRFTPVTQGRSAGARMIVGAILIVVGYIFPPIGVYTIPMGIALMVGGLVEMLSPQPKTDDSTTSDGASYYFNGAVNTVTQGNPVPLVYGRLRVGSQAINAAVTIDQLMS